jgi:hypothetical protein
MNPEHLLKLVKELLSGLWFECSEYSLHPTLHPTCSLAVALGSSLTSTVLCIMFHMTRICYGERIVCLWPFPSHQNHPFCALY